MINGIGSIKNKTGVYSCFFVAELEALDFSLTIMFQPSTLCGYNFDLNTNISFTLYVS